MLVVPGSATVKLCNYCGQEGWSVFSLANRFFLENDFAKVVKSLKMQIGLMSKKFYLLILLKMLIM